MATDDAINSSPPAPKPYLRARFRGYLKRRARQLLRLLLFLGLFLLASAALLEIYRNAFQYNEVGAAAAVAMALAVIIFAVTLLILVRGERKSA